MGALSRISIKSKRIIMITAAIILTLAIMIATSSMATPAADMAALNA
ncbi:MAG: hypothetical protein M3275_05110 [Thermoproteota archaeon]|nr:hypothetical protein [Thermoproteota archaeon]